jgi:hypothetical protein
MSNVKVNGNAYNDVTSVRLPLADGSGYAVYSEGQSTDENAFLDNMLSGGGGGDYANDTITKLNHCTLTGGTYGTLSFPNVVGLVGGSAKIVASNLLIPNALNCELPAQFGASEISGTLDLRKYTAGIHGTTPAYGTNSTIHYLLNGANIGTLRLDALNSYRGNAFNNSTITNLVWGGADLIADNIKGDLNSATAITNLYITDAIYDDVAALISAGTITKVTNLHKYSEWSDT